MEKSEDTKNSEQNCSIEEIDSELRKTSVISTLSTTSTKSKKRFSFPRKNQSPKTSRGHVGRRWRSIRHAVRVTNAAASMRKNVSREDSFLKKFSTRQPYRTESMDSLQNDKTVENCKEESSRKYTVLHPDGRLMFYWLGVVTVATLYNLWTCIAREAFREIQYGHLGTWISFDVLCDTIFICDIIVQFRTGYLDQGIMVYDSKRLAKKYMSTKMIYLDTICLLPLDFLQFAIGIHPMLRFPRFLKVYRTFTFLYLLESRTQYPNFFRVANLTHILFLGSHWFAAFYYLISEAENFEGDWSYQKPEGAFAAVTRKYLTSLYWSTLTLTTIGDLPTPESNWEYVFVIFSYLIGVFIFATIVGQVGNVITNRNASRLEFERLLDGAKMYMQMHNVPNELQKRVQRWYDYAWKRGRMNGSDINSLGLLPDKLKTELAIHVNLETLKKVTIFQECQPEFLHDLVLKMRAYIFTPGDLICRRGEIAREMFIIADGLVEIISESGTVLTKMGTGDFFGEIGILNLDGGINRRTADVKSLGYSELFVLSREDVLEALKDHPDAEQIIRNYGHKRLKEIEQHRQKMKSENGLIPQRQTWSPASPCKHLNIPSKQPKRSRKKPGIKVSDVHLDLNPGLNGKTTTGVFGAMKNLVSKTQKPTSPSPDDNDLQWSVIARLSHGDVVTGHSSYSVENNNNRRYSLPSGIGNESPYMHREREPNLVQLKQLVKESDVGESNSVSRGQGQKRKSRSSTGSCNMEVVPEEDSLEIAVNTNNSDKPPSEAFLDQIDRISCTSTPDLSRRGDTSFEAHPQCCCNLFQNSIKEIQTHLNSETDVVCLPLPKKEVGLLTTKLTEEGRGSPTRPGCSTNNKTPYAKTQQETKKRHTT
ncbi:hypothetical protein FSP39_010629 [Pinctada imbricata]|uniref:Cyclic nucleotide-binding domain-containing protein n=1 Tax=Pinctada imbricata TaxID=66713 RepID=A0AA88XFB4_PINIB|nr:hypothetical protein FSP39_010629 [Pinctada imbricata]